MEKQLILHMLTTEDKLSPFDVNMAIDAGWQHCIPYTSVQEDEVQALVQDAIFSRGPNGVKRTGLFIGGRDIVSALSMQSAARGAMVPPFAIPTMADPSGAFTTAAGIVAVAEKHLQARFQLAVKDQRVLVFGGTGPVGMTAAILAVQAGAKQVALVSRKKERAQQAAERCLKEAGEQAASQAAAVVGISADEAAEHMRSTNIIVAAAAAGVQVMDEAQLSAAERLMIAVDVNAVPPSGIAGVEVMDDGRALEKSPSGALGIGAMAVGNVKYQAQHRLLKSMYTESKPADFHFEHACKEARIYLQSA